MTININCLLQLSVTSTDLCWLEEKLQQHEKGFLTSKADKTQTDIKKYLLPAKFCNSATAFSSLRTYVSCDGLFRRDVKEFLK